MANSLLYAITVVIWGSTWFAITLQLGVVPPEVSVAYRFILAGAVLVIWCWARRRPLLLGWRNHLFIALQGLFLFSINYVLFYIAIQDLTSGLSAVVFSTIVLMNIAGAAVFFGTPVRPRVVLAAGIGLAGMALLFWPDLRDFDLGSGPVQGLVLSLLATACVSIGNLLSARNQMRGLGVLETNALGMTYGGAFTLLYALAVDAPLVFEASVRYAGSLIYLAILGSVVGFGCYLTLLGRIGAGRAAYAMVLFPVIALAFSTALEGYRWEPLAVAGVALILIGNVLVLARTGETARAARSTLKPEI